MHNDTHDIILFYSFLLTLQSTEWNFDPEEGKERRIRYEQENGRFGEYAIAKLGTGTGFKGPWGNPVKN